MNERQQRPEYVPEAGPTLATTPSRSWSGPRVQRSSRRLPSASPEFYERGSSQSGWESEFANETTGTPTAECVRSRLREMKGKIPEDDENCVGLSQNEPSIVEALAYEAAGESLRKQRGSEHHRTRSMSESSPSSDASGVADENLVRRLAARRPGALCQDW